MRAPTIRASFLRDDELIVDCFAGGGGASTGITWALGRDPDIAINHSAEALAVHAANHPRTKHFREDVWRVNPKTACAGRPVGLLWISPDCRHFSKSKGGKPRSKKIRSLAWAAVRWAHDVRPRVICLENVEEFCFPGETLVWTSTGLVPIRDVSVGDEVLTHQGRFRRVIAKTSRLADTVVVKGTNGAVECTDNHQFYARPVTARCVGGKGGRHWRDLGAPAWIAARDLVPSDRDRAEMTTYRKAYSGHAWAQPRVFPSAAIPPLPLPLATNDSIGFWRMVGRWLGDGWIRKRRGRADGIRICENAKKADVLAVELAEVAGLTWNRQHRPSVHVFETTSASLANWLIDHFGQGAVGKTIPAWALSLPEQSKRALVTGFASADGYQGADGRFRGATVSKQLAYGLKALLDSIGVPAGVSSSPPAKTMSIVKGRRVIGRHTVHSVSWKWTGRGVAQHIDDELHRWTKVRSVSPGRLGVEVFDLTVEEDHSFVADGFVVHNCTWGPLNPDGTPNKARAGQTFRAFVRKLERMGYVVEWRELVAADYGAPTTRNRLFMVARCDGHPIVWPEATHGAGRSNAWRAAHEIIDWSIPCPSIFGRKKPLVEATERRIFEGLRRYVLHNPQPFIVPLTHHGNRRAHPMHEPLPTVTAAHRGELALVAPTIVKAYGGPNGNTNAGVDVRDPIGTVTTQDHHWLAAAWLTKMYGTSHSASTQLPLPTVTANGRGGGHLFDTRAVLAKPGDVSRAEQVRAFLVKWYKTGGQQQSLFEPLHTVTTKARFGLVLVHGEPYEIVDIRLRMLAPRELFRANSFPDSYVIDPVFGGKPLTKTAQTFCAGNAVPPVMAEAIVGAQFGTREAVAA